MGYASQDAHHGQRKDVNENFSKFDRDRPQRRPEIPAVLPDECHNKICRMGDAQGLIFPFFFGPDAWERR